MSHHEEPQLHQPEAAGMGPVGWIVSLIGAGILGFLIYYNIIHLHDGHHAPTEAPPMWGIGILPFVALLGCIAVLPLIPATHHWWESNLNRFIIAMICAVATLAYIAIAEGTDKILPTLNHAVPGEYVPFIVLLFSLYVISGGISLKGDLAAHPLTNTAFLAFGAAIASFIGTTGASMLLIRPLLQTNSERKHVVHTVVFFIFLVSNIGGTLLPIGDPPLFLGYLRGVDFFWTFNLWMEWAFCCSLLLVIYFVVDTIAYRKETFTDVVRDDTERQPLRLKGAINILWLAGVVACVASVNHETTLIHKPLTGETTIAQLNGGRGAETGKLDVIDSTGAHATVDLEGVTNASEIAARLSAAEGVSIEASIVENRLQVRDTAGGNAPLTVCSYAPAHEDETHEGGAHEEEAHEGEAHEGEDAVYAAAHAHHPDETAASLGLMCTSETGVIDGKDINPGWTPFPFLREALMMLLVGLSLVSTPKGIREDNHFNYAAIIEVAALFIGIFIAMQVPIEVLKVYGNELGLTEPWHFYWATGSLSSFLDNAPTYVVFFETAGSLSTEVHEHTVIAPHLLVGISLGAVFMGAMTYIGNGPNFMVKSIAEQSGVKMPSFFGYMIKYSIPFLIPVFIVITLLFLGGGHGNPGHTEHGAATEAPAAQIEPAAHAAAEAEQHEGGPR